MKTPLTRARPTAQASLFKTVESDKNVTQKPVSKPSKKSPSKPTSQPAQSTLIAAQSKKLSAKKPVAAKPVGSSAAAESPIQKPVAPAKTKISALEATSTLKATKKRAPKNLANQYGAGVEAIRIVVEKAAPRKRRNAATRAKLQAVITPDDALLLRLARAGAISSNHVSENGSGGGEKSFRSSIQRRSRKWETRCGKCGVSAQYAAEAALCIKCGAILVRD